VAVLVALGAWLVSPRARAQSVVVGPLPSSMSAIPGASITVPVVADLTSSGGASLGSIAARLTWKPGTLAFVSTGIGALGSPVVNTDSASFGILKFALANAGGATGMPVLLNATFNVTGAPADTTILGLTVSEITAAGTFANLTPITTGAHFCTSTGLWGDLDGGPTITAHDALIILTYAVGLPVAPYTVVNGDVDHSGAVDTRDALIVLSYAVGIPVTQFRIGQINPGICSLGSAATVQIQPRTPTVAPGDSLPVTVVVRDSTGALVQGVGLVWQSKDSTIMRPGAGGSLIAVVTGTTYALVYVQPGVKDSVPVVVTPTRHVWYVNPMVAANNLGVELGSQLYPYASIDTAMAHAAANDTVRVAVTDYGPVHITKPLTMLGDSTAAGFPRLSSATASPAGPALRVDSVPGTVTIQGFRLLNSQKGLVAKYVQTLVLGSVSVEGSRDLGVRIFAVDSAMLSHVSVVGAVSEGIELDSVRTAVLDHLRGDAIAGAKGGGSAPLALKVAQIMALGGDSITLGSAGAFVDSAMGVTLRRVRVANSAGPALVVNANTISVVAGDFSGATAGGGTSSTYTVALNAGGALEGPPQGSIRFDSSKVHNNGLWGLALNGGATVSLRADTVAGNYAGPEDPSSAIYDFGRLSLAQSAFIGSTPGYVVIEGTGADTVTADTTVFDGTEAYVYDVAAFLMHGGAVRNGVYPPMLDVESVPAVELDSIEASGSRSGYGSGPAVGIYDADTVTVNGINAHDNAPSAFEAEYATALRVNGGMMLNNGGPYTGTSRATLSAYYVGDTRVYGLTLRDSADVGLLITPTGTSRTVVDSSFLEGSGTLIQEYRCCTVNSDTLIVSRSSLTGFGGTSGTGISASYLAKLAVTGSLMDSLWSTAVSASDMDTTIVSHNTLRAWGGYGVSENYGVVTADSNTFAACAPFGAAVYAWQAGTTTVAGNTMTGCGSLLWMSGQPAYSGPDVQVLGNTLWSDTSANPAIALQNGLGFVQVAGNSITGGTSGGILIGFPYYNTGYSADTARVDSNAVQQTLGDGIRVNNVNRGLSLRYNLASDNRGYGLFSYVPFVAESNTVALNLNGVGDSSTYMAYYRNGNIAGNTHWGAATFFSSLNADSNWWGDPLGPRCVEICNLASSGDSISSSLVRYAPVDSLGPVLGAPSIPGPPGAPPVRRALASRAASAPRAPKAPAGAEQRPLGVPPAALAAPWRATPAVPRPVRPTGRTTGHHRPAWKTGVPR
jgi:hypothetical protein